MASTNKSRRKFIKNSAIASSIFIVPRNVLGGVGYTSPSDKLNIAGIGLNHLKNNLIYENEMKDMLEYFDKVVSSEKCVTDRSKRLKEMVEQVEKEGRVTKEKLTEWIKNDRPYGVALTPYRRALLKHPNIYDSDGVEPQYIWKKE